MNSNMQTYSDLANSSSQAVTQAYSTSFYSSVSMLDPSIQSHIHNIYGFVRLADEIVDSFLALKPSLKMHTYSDGANAFDIVKTCRLKQAGKK